MFPASTERMVEEEKGTSYIVQQKRFWGGTLWGTSPLPGATEMNSTKGSQRQKELHLPLHCDVDSKIGFLTQN